MTFNNDLIEFRAYDKKAKMFYACLTNVFFENSPQGINQATFLHHLGDETKSDCYDDKCIYCTFSRRKLDYCKLINPKCYSKYFIEIPAPNEQNVKGLSYIDSKQNCDNLQKIAKEENVNIVVKPAPKPHITERVDKAFMEWMMRWGQCWKEPHVMLMSEDAYKEWEIAHPRCSYRIRKYTADWIDYRNIRVRRSPDVKDIEVF